MSKTTTLYYLFLTAEAETRAETFPESVSLAYLPDEDRVVAYDHISDSQHAPEDLPRKMAERMLVAETSFYVPLREGNRFENPDKIVTDMLSLSLEKCAKPPSKKGPNSLASIRSKEIRKLDRALKAYGFPRGWTDFKIAQATQLTAKTSFAESRISSASSNPRLSFYIDSRIPEQLNPNLPLSYDMAYILDLALDVEGKKPTSENKLTKYHLVVASESEIPEESRPFLKKIGEGSIVIPVVKDGIFVPREEIYKALKAVGKYSGFEQALRIEGFTRDEMDKLRNKQTAYMASACRTQRTVYSGSLKKLSA